MSNKVQLKSPKKKIADLINKITEDKKAIHAQITKGGKLSELKAKGIRFVKPI